MLAVGKAVNGAEPRLQKRDCTSDVAGCTRLIVARKLRFSTGSPPEGRWKILDETCVCRKRDPMLWILFIDDDEDLAPSELKSRCDRIVAMEMTFSPRLRWR